MSFVRTDGGITSPPCPMSARDNGNPPTPLAVERV
eukprot:CAMPEP_0195114860 /NCGR_PEP_ID=MMETSP0448-20130528/107200_1 /TAXON_ID=66468 /ORGANISM="Heterocapsa triquestra, Strain CCMP 448" /LENGTH=34 /DNA_ID= /DNA_START= /DNA_END= /DNA_ORIENTATION=